MSRITFSSNLTVDHAISLPQFQNNYGQTADGTSSWGDKGNLTDYDNVGNWFGNGITAINSLTFQTGNDKMQTYFSYANTRGTGIVDSNKLQKHNITFRETASFFNDRLKLDGIRWLACILFPVVPIWLPTLKTLKFSILTAI